MDRLYIRIKKGAVTRIVGGRRPLHLALIAVLGLLVYSNTFHAPFQWDDKYSFIAENPIVKDLSYFLEPSKAEGFKYYDTLKRRYTGYLTFALNYKLHGFNPMGFHIFNITVHILNALLVYLLVMLTFRTPFLKESSLRRHSEYIALFTALVFVSHPVQTQAVTYIYQRLASLVTFFYLLSVLAYAGARVSTGNIRRYALYALALISTVLAMKTKENAFTLPVVIALYEFVFLSDTLKRRFVYLFPFLVTMSVIPLTVIDMDRPFGEAMVEATRTLDVIPRRDYLFTQPRVIVTYLRLLVAPVNQNLDYDYPVFSSFFTPQVFLSSLFLLCLFSLLVYLYRRSQRTEAGLRLVAFGGLWFFITLSVESSIITLGNVIYEHRVYLSSAGAFLAAISGTFLLAGRLRNKKTRTFAVSFFVLILLVFSYAAYARNSVWRSEISLWEDVVRKSPEKAGGYLNLGNAYRAKGRFNRAIEHYRTAVIIKPNYAQAHNNLGVAYMSMGATDKAIEHFQTALRLNPDNAGAHCNLGNAHRANGMNDKAIEHYNIALRLNPDLVQAHNNLGNIYLSEGLPDKAIQHYRIALRLKPDYADAHFNLGLAYLEKGLMEEARREFGTVLQIDPDFHEARRLLNQTKGNL